MGLEDIPEMEIAREVDFDVVPLLFEDPNKKFGGKFVVMSGPNSKIYIFALATDLSSHLYIANTFLERHFEMDDENRKLFSPSGGGYLQIKDKIISLSDESERYGKYDKLSIRPIVERYSAEKLPNHSIDLS